MRAADSGVDEAPAASVPAARLGAVKWPDWKKGSQFMRHILEAARGHGPQLDDQSMLLVRIL